MSSMNSRAPTDLHSRMNPLTSHDDAPDDEQQPPRMSLKEKSRSSLSSYSNHSNNYSPTTESPHDEVDEGAIDDDDEMMPGGASAIAKKKKVKDRPWKKNSEYNSISKTCEEDMDIIGVSNVVSPNYKASSASAFVASTNSAVTKKSDGKYEDIYSYDDNVSPRWNNHQSSPEDVKTATVNAVGIAATQLADKLDEEQDSDDDFEDNGDDDIISYDDLHPDLKLHSNSRHTHNHSYIDKENEFATPRKTADHNRVRMEALNLLNLADNKSSGGYLIRGESLKSNAKSRTSSSTNAATLKDNLVHDTRKNRVQSALQGLSGGLSIDAKRRKYEKFTPEKMEYDEEDDVDGVSRHAGMQNGMDDVAMKDKRSKLFSSDDGTSPKSGTWGSRYSIDRHLMALHGGLSSREVLQNMEQGQYGDLHKQKQHMSATNMFKTSPHDHEDRWNVTRGARTVPERQSRIWYTWIAALRESVDKVASKISAALKHDGDTTLGSHRQVDHSSSTPKGIFTGVAVTNFLHKLSPTSRSAAMRSFTDPDDINFSAQDDYVYDQRLKRKKLFTMLVTSILLSIIAIGLVAGLTDRHKSGIAKSIYSNVGEDLRFIVTSDTPHNTADEIKLARDLANLHPKDGDFLIHLGDVGGDASVNMCTMSVYEDAADLLKQSPIPVFVIPGDDDWNNCPDPRSAFGYWMDELNRFEDNFDKEENTNFPVVRRQIARSENFSFLHKGVLFMAFHLVDGNVQSESEWSLRIAEDVSWMDEEFNSHGVEDYRAVVILAHSAPKAKVGDFVWPLKNHLMKIKKPVLYLHANDADGMLEYNPFPQDVPRLSVVRLEKGYKVAPTRILIEKGPKPFRIEMNKR